MGCAFLTAAPLGMILLLLGLGPMKAAVLEAEAAAGLSGR